MNFLGKKTRHTIVDAIVMADWDVIGYMKPFDSPESNSLGGHSGTFSSSNAYCQATVVEDVTARNNSVLKLTFDASYAGTYCGYWTSLLNIDLGDMKEIFLRLYAPESVPPMLLGLRYRPWVEAKVPIQPYLSAPDEKGWRTVTIPLSAFRGLPSLSSMDALFITFENKISSEKGTIFIDDIKFHSQPSFSKVVDLDIHDIEHNYWVANFALSRREQRLFLLVIMRIHQTYHQ